MANSIFRELKMGKETFLPVSVENNIFKIVNQLEIQGFENRIPDAILYINGLPLVVFVNSR